MSEVLGGFLAFGILHLRGVQGSAGWRWLFLIEVEPPIPYLKARTYSLIGSSYFLGRSLRIRSDAIESNIHRKLVSREERLVHRA